MTDSRLPGKYKSLECFLSEWVLPTQTARLTKRLASDFAEVKAFYDAMTPLLPDILAEFETRPLADLTPEENTLLDRNGVVSVKSGSVRLDHGGRRIFKKKKYKNKQY